MSGFQLIVHGTDTAARNMAVDEALLDSVSCGASPATVRIYGWQPAAVSIGRFQSAAEALPAVPGRPGIDWVRRPTGGRAVFHAGEITYSFALARAHPLGQGSLRDAYLGIGEVLRAALHHLGVPDITFESSRRRRSISGAACFDSPGDFELSAAGKKLVGSAQLRRSGGILQHGSIPVSADYRTIVDRLALDEEQKLSLSWKLKESSTCLEEVLGLSLDPGAVVSTFVEGLRGALPGLEQRRLSAAEEAAAKTLESEKYCSARWNSLR